MASSVASTSKTSIEDMSSTGTVQQGKLARMEPAKKYALFAFASVGVTLLVTGATGPRLLRRLQNIARRETTTATTSDASVAAATKRVRLKDLPSSSRSRSSPSPGGMSAYAVDPRETYFSTNLQILAQSNAWARHLDEQDRLFAEGEAGAPSLPPDDNFNPALFAFKAFAIATAIVATSFSAAIYALMRYYDIQDASRLSELLSGGLADSGMKQVRDLGLALSQTVSPVLEQKKPELPSWAKPTHTVGVAEDETSESEQEELSYWSQLKDSLDKEAAEDVIRKRKAWQDRQRLSSSSSSSSS